MRLSSVEFPWTVSSERHIVLCTRVRYGRSRSSKGVDSGSDREGIKGLPISDQ